MTVTILMPSLNEAASIKDQIAALPVRELQEQGRDVQVLLVDGGSTDGTADLARKEGIEVITAPRGYGLQFIEGFSHARGDIIVTCDSDLSYPVEMIPGLIARLEESGLDFLTVNRFSRMVPGAMRPLNYVGNRILSFTLRMLFNLPIEDSQSGMWVFRKEILGKITLKSPGMPFSQEIKIEAFRKTKARETAGAYYKRVGNTKLKAFQDGAILLAALIAKRLTP
jgi:glycosyltransferase involved in cell wall biosynthesis